MAFAILAGRTLPGVAPAGQATSFPRAAAALAAAGWAAAGAAATEGSRGLPVSRILDQARCREHDGHGGLVVLAAAPLAALTPPLSPKGQ